MRVPWKAVVMAVAMSAAIGGPAATAGAATTAPTSTADSCWGAPLKAKEYYGAEYWLSYNSCTRQARAGIEMDSYEGYGFDFWVYNLDTGATQDSYDGQAVGYTYYTQPVDDANTQSHACIQPYSDTTGAVEPKQCTDPY